MSAAQAAEILSKRPGLRRRLLALWSDRLFPGQTPAEPAGPAVRVCEAILVLAAALLSFSQLNCPLQEPEETLYAEVSRQMLAEGRLLVPVRHGRALYDKPPLLYWLVMGAYRLVGVHDWAARLVCSGAAFLCVLVTYAWGKRAVGPRAAFAGALMLCLSPRWAQLARMVSMNSLLTLWVIAALAAAHRALAGPRLSRRWWLLSALACGLAFLTKGPVALALVAVPVLLYQVLDRRCARLEWRSWAAYVGLVALVGLPWLVILAVRDPAFVYYFVWIHHVRRVLAPIDHPQSFWYYGPVLLVGMLPWALLLPGLVKHLARRAGHGLPQRTGDLGFFLLAGGWSLLFFSAAGCKRPCYILPIMPPLALALGCYVDAACRLGRLRAAHWGCAAAATFVLLMAAVHWLLPWYADRYSVRDRVLPHRQACAGGAPVLCYPHVWDGVSFYLQRNDVRVYRPDDLGSMVSALQRQPRSLVVVKEDVSLTRLLEALPASLEFVQCGRQHPVAVGWVRERILTPAPSPGSHTSASRTAGTHKKRQILHLLPLNGN
jgi:4-amino-4-deoxy-L-arabinose transferase-like glycosyltransferase